MVGDFIFDIILVVIGALIGFGASIATIIIERWLDRQGKINVFYRITYQAGTDGLPWGFDNSADGKKYFSVPIDFEFQNTSNTTRVIRDVSVVLFHGAKKVKKMLQLNYMRTTHQKGNSETEIEQEFFGTEKGSYSFVLQPRSIQRQSCEYLLCIQNDETQEMEFDNIKLQYYDEKNKKHIGCMRAIKDCWKSQEFDVDEDWVLLNTKRG